MHKITLHSWKHDSCFQLNIPIGAAIFSNLSGPFSLWDSKEQLFGFFPSHKKPGKVCAHSRRCSDVSCELGTMLLQPETATVQLISGLCFPGPRSCPQRRPLKFDLCQSASSIYNVRKEYLVRITWFGGLNKWFAHKWWFFYCTNVSMLLQFSFDSVWQNNFLICLSSWPLRWGMGSSQLDKRGCLSFRTLCNHR